MKKTAVIFCTLALLFTGGCSVPEITELSDRLIIEAVGIDMNGDMFEVSVQALDSISAGLTENAVPDAMTQTLVFSGKTVGEALGKINTQTGLRPLYSQIRVIVIGHETVNGHITEALDFFLREYTARAEVLIAAAQSSATEILSASFGKNRIGADIIADAIMSGEQTGETAGIQLYKFINLLLSEPDSAYCPEIGVKDSADGEKSELTINGTVIFDSTYIGTLLSNTETLGLLLLTDRLEKAGITAEGENGNFTLRIVKSNTAVKAVRDGGKYRFDITASIICDITEYSSKNNARLNTADIDSAARAASEKLQEIMSDTLTKCFYENGCDICRLQKRKHLKYPYSEKTEDIVCGITAKVTIRRTGKETLKYSATI